MKNVWRLRSNEMRPVCFSDCLLVPAPYYFSIVPNAGMRQHVVCHDLHLPTQVSAITSQPNHNIISMARCKTVVSAMQILQFCTVPSICTHDIITTLYDTLTNNYSLNHYHWTPLPRRTNNAEFDYFFFDVSPIYDAHGTSLWWAKWWPNRDPVWLYVQYWTIEARWRTYASRNRAA